MLSTKKLEKYIKKEISSRLGDLNYEKIYFEKYSNNDGVFVFSQNDAYHIVYVEKGEIKENKILFQKEEVLWFVLETLAFEITMEYAIKNKSKDKDFRRALFRKEIAIYSLFGEKFLQKKEKEIEEILKKSSYNDID